MIVTLDASELKLAIDDVERSLKLLQSKINKLGGSLLVPSISFGTIHVITSEDPNSHCTKVKFSRRRENSKASHVPFIGPENRSLQVLLY